MFISHRFRLLFFEVPRTASRTISDALTKLDPLSPTVLTRYIRDSSADYHRFDNELVAAHPDYALLAVHRNPYDRVLSHFKFRKSTGNPEILRSYEFAQYVGLSCERDSLVTHWNKDVAITDMLPISRVTHWLRFEHLLEDWRDLAQSLNTELPKLEHLNASKPRSNALYTSELAAIVSDRMREDFEFFAYDIDSWRLL